jgi:hypothetical protein
MHWPYFLAAYKIFKLHTVESNHNFARAGMVSMFAQPYALKQNPNKIWQFEYNQYMQFVILFRWLLRSHLEVVMALDFILQTLRIESDYDRTLFLFIFELKLFKGLIFSERTFGS